MKEIKIIHMLLPRVNYGYNFGAELPRMFPYIYTQTCIFLKIMSRTTHFVYRTT